MAYKYLAAGLSIQKSPKNTFVGDFQQMILDGFYLAHDWYTIQEETTFGSGTLANVDVRINTAINVKTGVNLGDDFKIILFKELDHATGIGYLYYFDDNWWITVNSEIYKNVAASATIRRCNNMLRWIDSNGAYRTAPCAIDYLIRENRDYGTVQSALILPSGFVDVTAQANSITNTITHNQRFLFGNTSNWVAYKVLGGGVNNYNNQKTADNTTNRLLKLSLMANFLNSDVDDLVNGIADSGNKAYVVTIENDSVAGIVGNTIQLNYHVSLNDEIVTRDVIWSSSDATIASVSAAGLVTLVKAGSCTITCTLKNNSFVTDTASVTVGVVPPANYQVVFTPNTNYILEGEHQEYLVALYLNGVAQADTFTFTITSSNVPVENYIVEEIDGNNIRITNRIKYPNEPLTINCVSGAHSAVLSVILKGVW